MDTNRAKLIYFSPTRTTKKILEAIAAGLQCETLETVDLTPPQAKTATPGRLQDELVVFGAPVYSGRIPPQAAERIRRFQGNNTPAVVVVVYGNRAYEDALLELRDIAAAAGFIPVAGGAFIGEHSYADAETPIAVGRPDPSDLEKARRFGEKIGKRLSEIPTLSAIGSLQVPGAHPYRERPQRGPASPVTLQELCTQCGTCAAVCPEAAVTVSQTVETDPAACIVCFACVKSCPTGARRMEDPGVRERAKRLSETCRARKEPEIFVVEPAGPPA